MIKQKNIVMTLLGLVVFALLAQGCGESEYRKRQNEYTKLRKEIPREAYPDFFYDKFGDNWYKFRTLAGDETVSIPNYPIMRIEYVKGQTLPIILDEKTRQTDSFGFHIGGGRPKKAYKDVMEKHNVKRFSFHKSTLLLSPRRVAVLERPNNKWQAISDEWEVFGWENGGKTPVYLRSRRPLYFDQHVFVSFGTWDIRTAPVPLTGEHIDSAYPFIDVTLEVAFLDERLSTLGLEKGSKEYLAAFSRRVTAKVKFLEAMVADIYVGPELPDDVKALARGGG